MSTDHVTSTASSTQPLVVICATAPWAGHRLSDQHVARQLARFASVLYVDPPLSSWDLRRRRIDSPTLARPRLDAVAPRITRLRVAVSPGRERLGVKPVTLALTRRALRWAVQAMGAPPVHAVIVPSLNPLFGACGEQLRVFHAKDDNVAGARLMGVPTRRLQRRERMLLQGADLVLTASPVLAEKWQQEGSECVLLPPGCDVSAFADVDRLTPPPELRLPPPVAGFFGHLSDRVDVAALEAVRDAGHSLLLVGPMHRSADRRRWRDLLRASQVHWVGAQPYEALPRYLRATDVGLVPYLDTPFNRASFPLKTMDYLAAGRAVVSTDLPSVRWLDTALIRIARTPAEFAAATTAALATPTRPEDRQRRQAFAGEHCWSARGDQLAEVLGLALVKGAAS